MLPSHTIHSSERVGQGRVPEYLKRAFRFNLMDFEFALSQMVQLCFAPQSVFRASKHRKLTKNHWCVSVQEPCLATCVPFVPVSYQRALRAQMATKRHGPGLRSPPRGPAPSGVVCGHFCPLWAPSPVGGGCGAELGGSPEPKPVVRRGHHWGMPTPEVRAVAGAGADFFRVTCCCCLLLVVVAFSSHGERGVVIETVIFLAKLT